MRVHTNRSDTAPLPRLGVNVKGWGNPFVWANTMDPPAKTNLGRIGKKSAEFEWPGRLSIAEDHPWLQLANIIH